LFRLSQIQKEQFSTELRKVFRDDEIVIVCALRSRTEFAESLYRNSFRAYAKVPDEFNVWLESARNTFRYEYIIDTYVKHLGSKLLLLPYARSNKDKFVDIFFDRIGIDVNGAEKAMKLKNPSLDVVDCLAKSLVMNGHCESKLSQAFNNFCFRHRVESHYAFLNRENYASFRSSFSDEDARLIKREPLLSEALADSEPTGALSAIDDACHEAAGARRDSYLSFRRGR
jgi:hypothetical protein